MPNKIFFLSVLLFANIANPAIPSTTIPSATLDQLHQRSLILLAKYNLNPTNRTPIYKEPVLDFILPVNYSFVLDTIDSNPQSYSKLGFTLLQDASASIGLNPAPYIGKRIFRLNYLLDDSTQSNTIITAHVLFSDTNLVGAHLRLDGFAPGIVALNDHSQFKPENFIFPIFNPDL